MKKLTAIISIILVGTMCLLLGYYLGKKKPPVQPRNISIMNYSDLAGRLPETVKEVEAIYPESAIRDRYEGVVAVAVTINDLGHVTECGVAMGVGRKDVADAAMAAAKQWEFKPILSDGKPGTAKAIIPFTFKLDSATTFR